MKLTKTLGLLAILAIVHPAMAEETAITVPDGELHMIGDATAGGWDLNATTPIMPSADNSDIYVWEGELKGGSEFKILTNLSDGWDAPTIHPLSAASPIGRETITDAPFACYVGGDDYKWYVEVPATYKLTFNIKDFTMSSEFIKETEIIWPEVTPIQTETLYLIGEATPAGWTIDNVVPCTKSEEGNIFVYEGDLGTGLFRATTDKEWGRHIRPKVNECEIGPDGLDGDFTYVDTPDYNWKVTTAGRYRLTFDLDKWTIKAEQKVEAGIDTIVNSDSDQPSVYYNLNGARVEEPVSGFYIVKQGNKVSKVVIR